MAGVPTGTVTFLFTDIEGSTKLAREHAEIWETLRAWHHEILRETIESHHGYVFQIIGDTFCAAFHTAGDALRAATRSQVNLQEKEWGDAPVNVRIGVHTSKAEIQENREFHTHWQNGALTALKPMHANNLAMQHLNPSSRRNKRCRGTKHLICC